MLTADKQVTEHLTWYSSNACVSQTTSDAVNAAVFVPCEEDPPWFVKTEEHTVGLLYIIRDGKIWT